MPNTPKGKKRKAVTKKSRERKPKRLKYDDESRPSQTQASQGKKQGEGQRAPSPSNRDEQATCSVPEKEEPELEKLLEEHAEKNNLTTTNVKSILHHVITDERVLAMVKQVDSEEDGLVEFNPEFSPKMTRAKCKETNQEDPIIAQLTRSSPAKKPAPKPSLIYFEFPESSSGEEYEPDDESEDTESYLSSQSDLASPFRPSSPDSVGVDADALTCASFSSVSRPLTRQRSQEIIFKEPLPPVPEEMVSGKSDLIAKRTRSHLPLTELPLEYFEATCSQLPDFMPDLYDTLCLDDLDNDDIEFQKWLQGIVNGNEALMEEDNEDLEYNFMAEDQKEEKEEYRNDKAVKIPQKEVSELFEGVLSEFDDADDRCVSPSDWNARMLLLDCLDTCLDTDEKLMFTTAQREQLATQFHQHTQLLTQIYLMARENPTLEEEANTCHQYINELQRFNERASSAHLIMALGGGEVRTSAFSTPELPDAVRIVNEPYTAPYSPREHSKSASPTKPKQKLTLAYRKSLQASPPPLSPTNMRIMFSSTLFKHTELLPHFGLHPKDSVKLKEVNKLRVKFMEAEDNLLAFGIKQFQNTWELIREHLLPVKDPKQLQIRCKNLSAARTRENVVKHLRRTNTLWKMPTRITSNIPSDCFSRRRKDVDTPEWLVTYRRKAKAAASKLVLPPTTTGKALSTLAPVTLSKTTVQSIRTALSTLAPVTLSKTTVQSIRTVPQTRTASSTSTTTVVGNGATTLVRSTIGREDSRNMNSAGKEDENRRRTHNERNEGTTVKTTNDTQEIRQTSCLESERNEDIKNQETLQNKTTKDNETSQDRELNSTGQEKTVHENSPLGVEEEHSVILETEDAAPPRTNKTNESKASREVSRIGDSTDDIEIETADTDTEVAQFTCDDEDSGEVHDVEQESVKGIPVEDQESTSPKNVAVEKADENCPAMPTSLTEDPVGSTTKANPSSTSGKGKVPRDKPPVSTSGRVTTRSQSAAIEGVSSTTKKTGSASQAAPRAYVLEPDPEGPTRAQAFAEGYLEKVRSVLKNDSDVYEEFLRTLVNSSSQMWSPIELYKRMEVVLSNFPSLIEDFVAFLEPEQAVEAGVVMTNLQFVRARMFLRKLEVHFLKTPSHFQKIIKAFSTWNTGKKMPVDLHEKIVPLLRGQQHLLEEFNSFFDDLKPPTCQEEDFEEVEIGSGSEPEVDDFEQVVIPKKVKEKPLKLRPPPATAKTAPTKPKLTRKTGIVSAPKALNTGSKPVSSKLRRKPKHGTAKKDSPVEEESKGIMSVQSEEEEDLGKTTEDAEDGPPKGASPQSESREQAEGNELLSEHDPRSVRTEGSTSDCPLSVAASSIHTETSNDSCRHEEHDFADFGTSGTEQFDRHSNIQSSMTHGGDVTHRSDEVTDTLTTGSTEEDIDGDDEDEDANDDVTSDGDDTSGDVSDSRPGTLSAKNHELGEDGRLVVLWNRDDDRIILQTCHDHGPTEQTFLELTTKLKSKSPQEIEKRFEDLMTLIQANASGASRGSTNEESSSDEDEEDDESGASEAETDP